MDRENIIKGLYDIGGIIVERLGIEQARNFLRTIDDALALLKEQEEEIKKLNRFVNGFSRDAMPVVRCKNCKHYRATRGYCAYDRIWQENKGHIWGMYCKPDWFCADGERKIDDA